VCGYGDRAILAGRCNVKLVEVAFAVFSGLELRDEFVGHVVDRSLIVGK